MKGEGRKRAPIPPPPPRARLHLSSPEPPGTWRPGLDASLSPSRLHPEAFTSLASSSGSCGPRCGVLGVGVPRGWLQRGVGMEVPLGGCGGCWSPGVVPVGCDTGRAGSRAWSRTAWCHGMAWGGRDIQAHLVLGMQKSFFLVLGCLEILQCDRYQALSFSFLDH